MRKLYFAVIFSVLLVSGCAGPYKHPLTSDVRSSIANLHIVTLTPQEEIDGQFVYSNAGAQGGAQGGFIGALVGAAIDAGINNSRSKDAENAIAPYRDILTGYNFNGVLHKEIKEGLGDVSWADKTVYYPDYTADSFKQKEFIKTLGDDALLLIIPRYSISPDFRLVNVDAYSALLVKGGKRKQSGKKILAHRVQYQSRATTLEDLISVGETDADNDSGSDLGGYVEADEDGNPLESRQQVQQLSLKDMLEQGARHIAELIRMDLEDKNPDDFYKSQQKKRGFLTYQGRGRSSINMNYYELGTFDEYSVYRVQNGSLYSSPIDENVRMRAALQ